MSLGIVSRSFKRGLPHRATMIDGVPVYLDVGNKWYVDGDLTGGDGLSWESAFATIQAAINAASAFDSIYIKARAMAASDTDPINYAEVLIIPAGKSKLRLIGVSDAANQGNQPQIKKASASTALLTIRSQGVTVSGISFNGGSATGGGILLDDDGSTKEAFGVVIENCFFKNCRGSSATDGRLGGAIQIGSAGGAWQLVIRHNRFYKNLADIVLLGTSQAVPQSIEILDNIFSGSGAATNSAVDVNIYLAGGSGVNDVNVLRNYFPALPAVGSGSVVRFMDLTQAVCGVVADNVFGDTTTATGYGVAKAKAKIPTVVFMAQNYNESGLITREA